MYGRSFGSQGLKLLVVPTLETDPQQPCIWAIALPKTPGAQFLPGWDAHGIAFAAPGEPVFSNVYISW